MSVNLSPIQLARRSLVDVVAEVLRTTSLEPARLSLELTETLLVNEAAAISETLRSLKALGVRVVLDDFGTGYSSLSYLSRLPIDALKVDRSFVSALGSDPSDQITAAIVAMAKALSLEVVAEGTETAEQVAELRRLGCDHAQGYLFSRPVPPAELLLLLERGVRAVAS
jgi:EAL domain-containing protein (putative c-di-GMP-specific phosphodiesterase class I)